MVLDKLKELLAEQFSVSADSIDEDTSFVDDLGADSLDIVELTMMLEEEFDLPEEEEEELLKLSTVGEDAEFLKERMD